MLIILISNTHWKDVKIKRIKIVKCNYILQLMAPFSRHLYPRISWPVCSVWMCAGLSFCFFVRIFCKVVYRYVYLRLLDSGLPPLTVKPCSSEKFPNVCRLYFHNNCIMWKPMCYKSMLLNLLCKIWWCRHCSIRLYHQSLLLSQIPRGFTLGVYKKRKIHTGTVLV